MLPKFFFSTMLCILLATQTTKALKCYECDNCGNGSDDYEKCEDGQNVCVKFKIGDLIAKGCQHENFCSLQNIEKGINDAWDKFKHTFTGEGAPRQRPEAISCCYTDYCNSGHNVRNALGVIGALFLAISLACI